MQGSEESTPRNIREEAVGLLDRPMDDSVQGMNMPVQPKDYIGAGEIIWQKVIKGEVSGMAKSILDQFQDPVEKAIELDLNPFLAPEFQDWLGQKRVLKRLPKDSESMRYLRNLAGEISKEQSMPQRKQLLLMLVSQERYLISRERLTVALGGQHYPNRDSTVDFNRVLFSLKKELGQPIAKNILFQVNAVGIGVGIENLELNHQEIFLLSQFYLSPGRVVSHMPQMRDGVPGRSNVLSVIVSGLNKKATANGYLFRIKPIRGSGCYILEELNELAA